MGRGLFTGVAVAVALLLFPEGASATRPATDHEIGSFRVAAHEVENITTCATLLRAAVLSSCSWVPRADYEPVITDALVSTLDEAWATAYLSPAPRTSEAATAVFRKETQPALADGVPTSRDVWHLLTTGNGCEMGQQVYGANHGTEVRLMPDLVLAMGCTPQIPTKVRCLDRPRTSLLALEKPRKCAVAGPEDSPFPGWMNVRELRWHRWGDEGKAWGLGVLRELPSRLIRRQYGVSTTGPAISSAVPLAPVSVRLEASERVSCGTSYFYGRLQVTSPFGQFDVTLPTCPDQFFASR